MTKINNVLLIITAIYLLTTDQKLKAEKSSLKYRLIHEKH
jgi:hypothetical protein